MPLILRNEKGSPLTNSEVDGNFTYLDSKIDATQQSSDDLASDLASTDSGKGAELVGAKDKDGQPSDVAAELAAGRSALATHKSSGDHDARYLRKDVAQSAPLLEDIPQSGVVHLPYDLDQYRAKLNSILYPSGTVPVFDQVFSHGASMLDPRITFTSGERTYIEGGVLKTAPANTPVFEDGAWRLRPQETNLALHSEDFSKSEWFKGIGVSVAPASIVNPKGASGAFKLTAVGPSSTSIFQPMSVTEGNKYTSFVFARAAEYKHLVVYSFGSSNPFSIVDLETGVATVTGSGHTVETVKLGGDWWCVFVTRTATSTSQGERVQFGASKSGSALEHDYDGTSGIYVWAAGFNEGDPIPYIPTTTSQVTVPADSALIQGADFADVFNPSEGAIVWDFDQTAFHPNSNNWLLGISDGTTNNLAGITSRPDGLAILWGGEMFTVSQIPLGSRKGGIAWNDGAFGAFLLGEKLGEKSFSGDLSLLNRMHIGGLLGSYYYYLAGILRANHLTIFTRRPSDDEMEALTS